MKFTMHVDQWEGNVDRGSSFGMERANTKQYLDLLDGKIRTQALIVPENKESSLLIGGGKDDCYVVTYTVGIDEDFYNLVDPGKAGDVDIELVTGGQAGLFPEKYCVTSEAVLAAINFYIDRGDRDPAQVWERQV